METLSSILMAAAVIAVIILLLKIIAAPMKLAFKLLLNALFGFIILFVFNFFGDFVGFTLGINWVNALITGCLGVPGVILLRLIKLFFCILITLHVCKNPVIRLDILRQLLYKYFAWKKPRRTFSEMSGAFL